MSSLRLGSLTRAVCAVGIVAAAASMAPAAASAAPVAGVSLQGMVLSPSDVSHYFGSGFKRITSTMLNPKTVALVEKTAQSPSKSFAKLGFRAGYIVVYNKSKGLTSFKNGKVVVKPGVSSVSAGVLSFKDSNGPKFEFSYIRSHPVKVGSMKFQIKPLSGLGDEAVVSMTSLAISKSIGAVSTVSVTWRHGAYVGTVTTSGTGSLKQSAVVNIARVVDARIGKFG
jgi:hypothetical protein